MQTEHKELARHALGLPNSRRQSYRNRYFISKGQPKFTAWMEMVDAGFATLTFEEGRLDCFSLTRAGALAALDRREKLCPEDFPPAGSNAND